jgi:hypothetical protein
MGILSKPKIDPQEELMGILGNLQGQSGWQALTQLGAGLAGNASKGWGAGIGAGLEGASGALQQGQNSRVGILGHLADYQLKQQQAEANAPWRQAQMDNMRSLMRSRDADAQLLQQLMGGGMGAPAGGPAQAPPTSPVSPIQPQSFTPGPQGAMPPNPLLQQVADQGAPMPPAQAPGQAPPTTPDVIDTPYGRMPRERALQLGGQLMLNPKYSTAGKALVEQAQGGKNPGSGIVANNQLEERTLNSATHLGRLNDIEKQFDPKFLEIPNRLKMMGASWSAKLGPQLGGKLAPDQQAELSRYAAFRSGSVNNLNTILKELSGAAVTPQEYERIQNDQPVAGTGIFDGDDPVSFQAKMARSTQTLRSAIARFNFMRSKGLNFDKNKLDQFMRLDDVPGEIDKRGAQIEQQLRMQNPNANPMQLQQGVQQQLKQEFGI